MDENRISYKGKATGANLGIESELASFVIPAGSLDLGEKLKLKISGKKANASGDHVGATFFIRAAGGLARFDDAVKCKDGDSDSSFTLNLEMHREERTPDPEEPETRVDYLIVKLGNDSQEIANALFDEHDIVVDINVRYGMTQTGTQPLKIDATTTTTIETIALDKVEG